MGRKARLTEGAKIEKAKLPPIVQDDLDDSFDDLANNPGAFGPKGVGKMDGVGPDGSRFNVEFDCRYDEDDDELWIDSIDIFSY